jgi:hypothetical protein
VVVGISEFNDDVDSIDPHFAGFLVWLNWTIIR